MVAFGLSGAAKGFAVFEYGLGWRILFWLATLPWVYCCGLAMLLKLHLLGGNVAERVFCLLAWLINGFGCLKAGYV